MEDFYCLLLASVPGIGPAHIKTVFSLCPDLDSFFSCPKQVLHQHIVDESVVSEIVRLQKKDSRLLQTIEKQKLFLEKNNCKILTEKHKNFPPLLKEICQSPALLFVKGNELVLTENQLGIVGSRKPTAYGKKAADYFAATTSEAGLVITSGLALGVDSIAHQACVNRKSKTIAVMASGIDQIYPWRNKKLTDEILEYGGALITEFPPGSPPVRQAFPRRNRIISGLSLGVLVIEAALRSGSLITAKYALEQNRDVFAVPGSVFNPLSEGCHQLLRQGAVLAENAQQILDEMCPGVITAQLELLEKPAAINTSAQVLSDDEQGLINMLSQDAISLEQLAIQSAMPLQALQVLLIKLELGGLVERRGIYVTLK